MNIRSYGSVALGAGLALGIAMIGTSALAHHPSEGEESCTHGSDRSGQQRLGDVTKNLEDAFNEQFVHGTIHRRALEGPINDVVEAMPEEARPQVTTHIDSILRTAERLAPQMTPEQRAEAVTPPSFDQIGENQAAQIANWGWGSLGGWGGFGAFAFPGMYGADALGSGASGYGAGWGGLGQGGWYQ